MLTLPTLYDKYFQKSRIFLYPLLGFVKGKDRAPVETYVKIHNRNTEYELICVYDNDKSIEFEVHKNKLEKHDLFSRNENHKNYYVCVFDLSVHKEDWNKVLEGRYSKISYLNKQKITRFFGNKTKNSVYVDSYLYPHKYYDIYSKLLEVPASMLKEVGELCDKPDMKKETFNSELLIYKV